MFEAIILIVDRLVSLLKERRAIDRDIFVQLIEPLFKRFEPAAENYILLFQRLAKDTADSKTSETLVTAFERFRQDRLDFYPTRRAVTALAHEYSESKVDEELANFFGNLEGFFYTDGEEESMSRQLEINLLRLLREMAGEEQRLDQVLNKIDRTPVVSAQSIKIGSEAKLHSDFFAREALLAKAEILREGLESSLQEYRNAVQPHLMDLTERWQLVQSGFARLRMRYMFPGQLTKL